MIKISTNQIKNLISILFLFTSLFLFAQSDSKKKGFMKVTLQTPTNKLENSTGFYEKLGFKIVSKESPLIYTDGKIFMEVNPERTARAGLKLYKTSWTSEVTKLKELTNLIKLSSGQGYLFYDPSGISIYLVESEFNTSYQVTDSSFSYLGNLAGLTLETADIKRSLALYEILGFIKTAGDADKGFVSLASDKFGITLLGPLMCPHLFFNPSLTYFNGKNNPSVIKKIRELNIPIAEEITGFSKDGTADNIIIRDPGGFGFFIFND
jgi:hypothetical protein